LELETEVAGFEAGTAFGTAVSLKLLAKYPKPQFVMALGAGLLDLEKNSPPKIV